MTNPNSINMNDLSKIISDIEIFSNNFVNAIPKDFLKQVNPIKSFNFEPKAERWVTIPLSEYNDLLADKVLLKDLLSEEKS